MTHPQRSVTVLLSAALVLALTACGIPVDDEPRPVDAPPGRYPFRSPAVVAAEPGGIAEPLCFVRNNELVRTVRHINDAPTVYTQIAHLLAGPNESERAAGLATALAGTTTVASVRLAGTEVTVELENDGNDAGRSDEVFAYGQIVCTITARPDVTGVIFTRNGQRVGVPRADGSLSLGPLTAADYEPLIAPG